MKPQKQVTMMIIYHVGTQNMPYKYKFWGTEWKHFPRTDKSAPGKQALIYDVGVLLLSTEFF